MKFTIAIPTYNNEKTIDKSIISALNQSFKEEYEILIVNNNSKDNTLSIIKEYEKKYDNVRVISNKDTVSMWMNHNVCLENATGDYVLFCHSDDELYKDALEILSQKINQRRYPDKYVVWGHSKFIDYQAILKLYEWDINQYIIGERAYNIFLSGGLTPSGTCYSRKSFVELGGFIEDNYSFPHSDSITMIKLAFEGFAFEMIEQMYFSREFASTPIVRNKKKLKEDYEYMQYVIKDNFNEQQIKQIISPYYGIKSYVYPYYVTKLKIYNNYLRKKTLKQLLKNPFIIKDFYFRKTLLRTIFN